jgi:hypothetical protein
LTGRARDPENPDVIRRAQALDARKRSLLRDLEKALLDAIAESPAVHRTLWKLQRAGYTLQLTLDCEREGEVEERPAVEPQPSFRIDSTDLAFLRSIGIDPTRKRRARRAP